MACTETFSTLLIFSVDIPPEEISAALELKATDIWVKDPTHKYRHKRERNIWKLCTDKLCSSVDNLEHIEVILNQLDGKEAALQELRDLGCVTRITNYWDSDGQGGPSLTPLLMQKLSDFGVEILWDVYFDDESET